MGDAAKYFQHNVADAKALMSAAGFGSGLDLRLRLDRSIKRLTAAEENRRAAGTSNLRYVYMDANALAFGEMSLDVVLAKYANFLPAEVYRVLRSGGVFITQQMGEREMANIFEAFGSTTFGDYWRARFQAVGKTFMSTVDAGRAFQALGAEIVRFDTYDLRQYFLDLDSLVFYLKASPMPEPFDPLKHSEAVTQIQQRHGSARGIETNSHRELLIIRRS